MILQPVSVLLVSIMFLAQVAGQSDDAAATAAGLRAERARLVARIAEIDRQLTALGAVQGKPSPEETAATLSDLVLRAKAERAAQLSRLKEEIDGLEVRARRGEVVREALLETKKRLAALPARPLDVPYMDSLALGQSGRLFQTLLIEDITGPDEAECIITGGERVPIVLSGVDTSSWRAGELVKARCYLVVGTRKGIPGGYGHERTAPVLVPIDLSGTEEFAAGK